MWWLPLKVFRLPRPPTKHTAHRIIARRQPVLPPRDRFWATWTQSAAGPVTVAASGEQAILPASEKNPEFPPETAEKWPEFHPHRGVFATKRFTLLDTSGMLSEESDCALFRRGDPGRRAQCGIIIFCGRRMGKWLLETESVGLLP